jgi:hypothetical protein
MSTKKSKSSKHGDKSSKHEDRDKISEDRDKISETNKEINFEKLKKDEPEFFLWLNTPFLLKTYGTITYHNNTINKFIKSIFALLYNGKVCFSSGTLVFNDIWKCLFNLITYNKIILNQHTYSCDSPFEDLNDRRYKIIASKFIHYQTNHKTHNAVFKQNKGIPVDCIPSSKYTKFERLFHPPLNKLCESTKSENKSVLLYYPFISVNSKKPLLFFKLERDQMISTGHVMKATATYLGNPIDKTFGTKFGVKERPNKGLDLEIGLDMRREDRNDFMHPNECKYNEYFYQKDILFYKNYYNILGQKLEESYLTSKFEEDFEELEWYNKHVRTGCEFYVTKNLMTAMLMNLLAPKKNINLIKLDYGGNKNKKRKTLKKHRHNNNAF